MESLIIKSTNNTPQINFDIDVSTLLIKGDSYPENAFSFYKPIMEWVEDFVDSKPKKIALELELIYFNSSTSKILYDLLDLFNDLNSSDTKVLVNWYYDKKNLAAFESGEEFQEDYEDLEFNLISH